MCAAKRRPARRPGTRARIAVALLAGGLLVAIAGVAHSQFVRANRRPPTVGKAYPGQLASGVGREIATRSCLKCHSASMITQQHKDAAAWTKTLTQMTTWGVELSDLERDHLRDYLVGHYGPRP